MRLNSKIRVIVQIIDYTIARKHTRLFMTWTSARAL